MPVYLVSRTVEEFSDKEARIEARAGVEKEREVNEQIPGVRWIRSYYSAEEGKVYCEYEAPSAELLIEHQRRAGLSLDKAVVVRRLEPSMFW